MTDEELIARLRKTISSGRTFHLSKHDRICAADRIEALLKTCDDLQDRLDMVNKSRAQAMALASKKGMRAEAAEAKLVKAVEALQKIAKTYPADADRLIHSGRAILFIARAALAELEKPQ